MTTSHLDSCNQYCIAFTAYTVCQLYEDSQFVGGGIDTTGFYCDFLIDNSWHEIDLCRVEKKVESILKDPPDIRFAYMMRENAASLFEHRGNRHLCAQILTANSNIVEVLHISNQVYYTPGLSEETEFEAPTLVKILGCTAGDNRGSYDLVKDKYFVRILAKCFASFADKKAFSKKYEKYQRKELHTIVGQSMQLFKVDDKLTWLPAGITLKNSIKDLFCEKAEFLSLLQVETVATDFKSKILSHLDVVSNLSHEDVVAIAEHGFLAQSFIPLNRAGLYESSICFADLITSYGDVTGQASLLQNLLNILQSNYKLLGLEVQWCFYSVSNSRCKDWLKRHMQAAIKKALQGCQLNVEEIKDDKSACPCLELKTTDSLGAVWSLAKIELINQPKILKQHKALFADEKKFAISHSIWGSLDTVIALIIEKYGDALPFRLQPTQVKILVLNEKCLNFAATVSHSMKQRGVRSVVDKRDLPLKEKIYQAHCQKITVIVIIGEQELKKELVSVIFKEQPNHCKTLTIAQLEQKLDDL